VAPDRWWRGFDGFLLRELPTRARVLDVGCGDGSLVERLARAGLDAVGVDPNAATGPRLIRERVETVEGIGHFDAVCSVMALHHADLEPVLEAIGRLLRPGGMLFVSEFSWEAYDDRAAAWVVAHDADREASVAAFRDEHDDLHTGERVRAALDVGFEPGAVLARPHLARMLSRPELEGEEHAEIERGRLPAVGWWYSGAPRA
jgi:SAM-dependent methyltransferase